MNQGGDAAEQIVRMTLNGTEVALKLTGKGVKYLAILLGRAIKKAFSGKKVKGKARLKSLIKNEKNLKIFGINDKDLKLFCKEAKRYGVLFSVIKDKKAKDGMTDLLIRGEDAAKVNRIFERFKLTAVERADVENQSDRDKDILPPVDERTEKQTESFLDRTTKQRTHKQTKDPSQSRGKDASASELFSDLEKPRSEDRPSVRQRLKNIRANREKERKRSVLREKFRPGKKHQKDATQQTPKVKFKVKKGKVR